MSRSFYLFSPSAEEDLLVTARKTPDLISSGPMDPNQETRKQQLSEALRAYNPCFCPEPLDYAQIARVEGVTEQEAQRRFRYLELNDRAGNPPLQLVLLDHGAMLTVHQWPESGSGEQFLTAVWPYFELLFQQAGYLVYDTEIDQILDPALGLEAALPCYAAMEREEMVVSGDQASRRPWWKFW